MTQKSLLHAVAAQIANGYETAEVPMYSEHLRMPDRKVIIKIIENLQKVFFPAYSFLKVHRCIFQSYPYCFLLLPCVLSP